MNYYIAERLESKNRSYLLGLTKRFFSLAEARAYLRKAQEDWRKEGLHTMGLTVNGELWGAEGRTAWVDGKCKVVHSLYIMATPIFFAGGHEGL